MNGEVSVLESLRNEKKAFRKGAIRRKRGLEGQRRGLKGCRRESRWRDREESCTGGRGRVLEGRKERVLKGIGTEEWGRRDGRKELN